MGVHLYQPRRKIFPSTINDLAPFRYFYVLSHGCNLSFVEKDRPPGLSPMTYCLYGRVRELSFHISFIAIQLDDFYDNVHPVFGVLLGDAVLSIFPKRSGSFQQSVSPQDSLPAAISCLTRHDRSDMVFHDVRKQEQFAGAGKDCFKTPKKLYIPESEGEMSMKDKLESALAKGRKAATTGKVADYIPELGKADPNALAVACCDMDGQITAAGDTETTITIQSISKVVSLALSMIDCGEKKVFSAVGVDPTADPFNSIMRLEMRAPHRPQNPLINAGAIVVLSLFCLLYTSPSPRDRTRSRMPSSA